MLRRTLLQRLATTSFLSDVEGSMDSFERFLRMSRVIQRDSTTGRLAFRSAEDRFVYGGDAFDKGDDFTFASTLLAFKQDFPDRVTLIAGNRDVNKIKLQTIFSSGKPFPSTPSDVAVPYYMSGFKHAVPYEHYLKKHHFTHSPVSLLRWHLACTMGAPQTFEHRRALLQSKKQSANSSSSVPVVSDEEVAESFWASARPGGLIANYLQHAQLAHIEQHSLFVHGSVGPASLGFVPKADLRNRSNFTSEGTPKVAGETFGTNVMEVAPFASLEEWVAQLNQFMKHCVDGWIAGDPQKGRSLMAYCHRRGIGLHTVVLGSPTNETGGIFTDLRVVEHLNAAGVFRVLTGHKPVGDVPFVVQQPGLTSIVADNSFGNGGALGRGPAVQEVLLHDDGVIAHGTRSDGTPFESNLEDEFLGVSIGDGYWTRFLREDRKTVMASKTTDDFRSFEWKAVDKDWVIQQAAVGGGAAAAAGGGAELSSNMFERFTTSQLNPPRALKTKRVSSEPSK